MRTFTITTFNARWGLTVADEPFDLLHAVQRFDSDVISLQEVWDPSEGGGTLEAAGNALGYEVIEVPLSPSAIDPAPRITPHVGDAGGTWGVALLSRLPVRGVRVVDLGRLAERSDVAERHAILAEVELDGTPLTVAATHLSFFLPNAAAQLRRLSGYLPTHRPSVVAGDCNLWGPLAATLVHRHRRAVRGRTWPAHRPHSQLDHLLVSPELQVLGAAVLPPAGSDHLPVRATLGLPG